MLPLVLLVLSSAHFLLGISAQQDPAFECAWRSLAYEYGQEIQPSLSLGRSQALFDALQLLACNGTRPTAAAASAAASAPFQVSQETISSSSNTYYVDPIKGSDDNDGSEAAPFQTVPRGVSATVENGGPNAFVVLRAGVHRLQSTLSLSVENSGLTITAFPGETPVLSGGHALSLGSWEAYNVTNASATWVEEDNANQAEVSGGCNVQVENVPSWQACELICKTWYAAAGNCTMWTWHNATNPSPWPYTCCPINAGAWNPVPQADHFSGHMVGGGPQNVWKATVSPLTALPAWMPADITAIPSLLFSPDGGASTQRATRARFPNGRPELDIFPVGWGGGSPAWLPTTIDFNTTVSYVNLSGINYPGMFQDHWMGSGGPCSKLTPPESVWCQPNGRTAAGTYWVHTPPGLQKASSYFPNSPSWTNPQLGHIAYWRGGHWFTMMARIDTFSAEQDTLTWTYGAFQGSEGDSNPAEAYVEGIFQELDAPNEFFLDFDAQVVYYFYNGTGAPPSSWTFEVPLLERLVSIIGTPAGPAKGITLSGLTFTSAAPGIMGPHGTPSGGDWGLARSGAVYLEGTEGVTVQGCTFTRVDGNAVSINAYNRNASIVGNEFVWLGDSAVASWGTTDGFDGTAGFFPLFNNVSFNFCHEYGIREKQSSCYFQAVTGQSTISNNVFFNGPRAHVNFNDGFWGGSQLTKTLAFNSCRESQDHGPFNSWDRVPYLSTALFGAGNPSVYHMFNELGPQNFFVAGGGANGGAFDNDDGSSRYHMHHNFEVYGGHKSDFNGHQKSSAFNLMVYANVYGPTCMSVGLPFVGSSPDGVSWNEGFYNNTCILDTPSGDYLKLGGGDLTNLTTITLTAGGNTLYTPDGNAFVDVGGKKLSPAEWVALGIDPGLKVSTYPSVPDIIQMAKTLLEMN